MMGDSAHGYGVGLFISGGECDLQNAGCGFGIVIKHFVKIAHPEKQNGIGVFLLDAPILLHHGSIVWCDFKTFSQNAHIVYELQVFKMRKKLIVGGLQVLRVDFGFPQNGHEISVAGPSWNDVAMNVLVITCSSRFPDIIPNVKTIGIDYGTQYLDTFAGQ
jgi:hypothetical protein